MKPFCYHCSTPLSFDVGLTGNLYVHPCTTCIPEEKQKSYHAGYNDGRGYVLDAVKNRE
jgi:hypothetical protein